MNKENIDSNIAKPENTNKHLPHKPLERRRQPSGTPLRFTIQKADPNIGEANRLKEAPLVTEPSSTASQVTNND